MNTRSLSLSIIATAAIALATAAPIVAQQTQGAAQNPPVPKPAETRSDAKPATLSAATLAGKWTANIDAQSGPVEAALDIKADPKDEKKFTGTISSQIGEAALQGNVADGKLTFTFTMNANGTDLNVSFTGAQQKDGSLAGTLNFGQGDVNWTAVKAK
jgi:hypothetical protein